MGRALPALVTALAAALAITAIGSATSAREPAFRGTIAPLPPALRATMTGVSWRPGCPVGLDDLRLVRAGHWSFGGQVKTGRIVVHRDVARVTLAGGRAVPLGSFLGMVGEGTFVKEERCSTG